MKKRFFVLALALVGISAFSSLIHAEESKSNFTFEVGADLVSSYLWRGQHLGGLSIQPSVTLDWNGLYLCGWGNIGADNWKFENINPELDITIGYDNYGFKLDLTHLYYFGGDNYFKGLGDANNTYKDAEGNITESLTTMELHAGIDIGEWVDIVPLTFDWYTTILGYDPVFDQDGLLKMNNNGNCKRAYSTYIEIGYDFEVWTDGNTIGFNNIQLRAEREFELKGLYINVWGEAMFNCYGVTKNNLINTVGDAEHQKLNACVGVGLYFGN